MKVKASTEKKKQGFGMTIPESVMVETGIAEAKCAELHRLKHCVAVLQGKMTAYELIETIRDINKLSEFLTVQLSKACGTCDDCGSCVQPQESKIKVPPELLDELNLPHNAKLEAYPDQDNRLILVGPASYEHDLTDIPEDFLKMLTDAGVCIGKLQELLMLEDTVYGR
jgi:hypothetical protein